MTTAKTKKATAPKPLEGKEVDSLEEIAERKEETGQALVNQFKIRTDKTWPSMFVIYREQGQVPGVLAGKYTSELLAKKAIEQHIGR